LYDEAPEGLAVLAVEVLPEIEEGNQRPTPPLNSYQITPITPRALGASGSSSEATLTTYSSVITTLPAPPLHESDANWGGEKANSSCTDRCA